MRQSIKEMLKMKIYVIRPEMIYIIDIYIIPFITYIQTRKNVIAT